MSVTIRSAIPSSALAIYAHPDDADVACAGTLARWAAHGCAVHLVVAATGAKGTSDAEVTEDEVAALRHEELAKACAVTGISFESLGLEDGSVEDTEALRRQLVGLIRQHRPEVVLGHDPTAIFFGQHYVNHRDHRQLGWAVLDAVAPAAAMPHYFSDQGEPFGVPEVLLTGTLEPDCFVDIAGYLDTKVEAVACHVSQFPGDADLIAEVVRGRCEDDGRRCGLTVAEGFRLLHLHG